MPRTSASISSAALTVFLLSASWPALSEEVKWPTSAFRPILIHQADNAQEICMDYLHMVRQDFFREFHPRSVPAFQSGFTRSAPVNLNEVAGFEDAWDYSQAIAGDMDGNGEPDLVYLARLGGANQNNYRDQHRLLHIHPDKTIAIPENRDSRLKRTGKESVFPPESYSEITSWPHRGALYGMDHVPRGHPDNAVAAGVAEDAYDLINNFGILDYHGRIFFSVSTPHMKSSFRTLLSYDSALRPRAECIVRANANPAKLTGNPFRNGELSRLLQNVHHIVGRRSPCDRGSSKPFYYARIARERFVIQALSQPWLQRNRSNSPKGPDGNTDFDIYLPYEYHWSLRDPFSRKEYASLHSRLPAAVEELTQFYERNFEVDPRTASGWAGEYLYSLRHNATASGEYYHQQKQVNDILTEARDRSATAERFIGLALKEGRWWTDRYERDQDGRWPQEVFDTALLLAVGADAPLAIVEELLRLGATSSGGESPALHNAVDRPILLSRLLESGPGPDARNGFGKTTLMVAAHMNQLQAVRILLEAGADVNAQTWLKDRKKENIWGRDTGCRYRGIRFRQRTPLMYAAENAGPEIAQLLINAGADKGAVDSQNRTVLDYLTRNQSISESERQALAGILGH